jgi:hypothetical protein
MDVKAITAILIGLAAILIVVVDVILITCYGKEASFSNVINEWAYPDGTNVNAVGVFFFGFIVGGLVIHFLEWRPINCDHEDE